MKIRENFNSVPKNARILGNKKVFKLNFPESFPVKNPVIDLVNAFRPIGAEERKSKTHAEENECSTEK